MLTNPLIRQQRVVDVIVFLLLLASQWMRLSDIGGITDITKHFRLRLTKQQQHHEIRLKCHYLYRKNVSVQKLWLFYFRKSHPWSLLQWAGVGSRESWTWDALLQDQKPAGGSELQSTQRKKIFRKKIIIDNFFESISWTRKTSPLLSTLSQQPGKIRQASYFHHTSHHIPSHHDEVFLWPHSIFICGILWMSIHNCNLNVNFTVQAVKYDFCPHPAQEISCGLNPVQWQETQRSQDCQWPPYHLQTCCVQLDLHCLW